MSDLTFTVSLDRTQFKKQVEEVRRDILGLSNITKSETSKMDSSFRDLSIGIAGYFSANMIQGFVSQLINVRGEFQKTEIAFATMLGNADQAKALMADMVNLAAKTPFSLQDVSSGAKQLLAFQVPANEVVDTLTRLGNIAAGLSVPLSRINLVYGQVKAKGRLMGDDLRQFTEAGIPMVAELAKKFGKTTAEISDMVSAGKIGFKDVQDVLFGLTNEGGMFFNLMEKQSKSVSGKISNLGDSFDQMLNKIGASNEGLIIDGIDSLSYLVENYQDVIDIVTGLVAVYGAYRASLIVNAAIVNVSAASEAGFTAAMMARLTITRLVDTATKALNATMLTNPTVLLIVGLSGLIYTYLKLRDTSTEAERTQKRFSKSMGEVKDATENLKKSTEEYLSIVKSEYSTQLQKFQAYQKLQALYPSMLKNISMENFLKMETVEINKLLARGQEEFGKAAFEKQIDKSAQRIQSLKNELKILNDSLGKGREGSDFAKLSIIEARNKALKAEENTYRKLQFIQRERNIDEEVSKMSAKDRSAYFEKEIKSLNTQLYQQRQKNKNLKDSDILTIKLGNSFANLSLNSVLLQIDKMKAGLSNANAAIQNQNKPKSARTKADWEKIREDAKTNLDSLSSSDAKGAKGAEYRAQIKEADKALEAWEIKVEKTKEKTKRDLAEVFSKGSIADLEQRISLWNEALQKAGGNSVSVLGKNKFGDTIKTGQTVSVQEALKNLEELEKVKAKREKEIRKLSFEEQINEIKRQFSVRDQLLQSGISKENVDAMFPEIKDKNLIQSLQEQAKAIKDILDAGKGDSATSENFTNLNEQIRVLLGQKSELENFSKFLNDGKQGKSSSEYIDFLNTQKTTGGTELDAAKNAEIYRRIEYEKQAIADAYRSFIDAHLSYEQQKTKITKDYDELRKQAKTKAELDAIDKAQRNDLSALALKEFQDSDAWVKGFQDLSNLANSELDKVISEFEKFEKEAGKSLSTTDLKTYIDALKQLKDEALNRNPFKALADAVKEYTQNAKEGKDTTESMKSVFKAVSSSASLTNQAISAGVDIADSLGVKMSDSTKEVVGHVQTTITGIGDLAAGIASKDPAQIIKGIAGVVKGLAGLFNGDRKKEKQIKEWADQVKNLKVQYQELERAIDKALGSDKYTAQQNVIANLERQKILLQQMIQKEKEKKKSDSGKIDDWNQQISDINAQIDDLKKKIIDDILQIDAKGLAEKIGDALIEGFGKGEDALASLNKTADEVFKEMVKNALKMELEKRMQPIIDQMLKAMGYSSTNNYDNDSIKKQIEELEKKKKWFIEESQFNDFYNSNEIEKINKEIADLLAKLSSNSTTTSGSFDGLTEEEREAIKAQIVAATGDYQKAMEQYADLFGPDAANNPNGLKGDIKGITEKTAGALESQINAIRIYQVEALNIAKNNQKTFLEALKYQAEIAINTRELKAIRQGIDDLVIKVKKL